eukprot:1701822-Prymnesium_polylepis.1
MARGVATTDRPPRVEWRARSLTLVDEPTSPVSSSRPTRQSSTRRSSERRSSVRSSAPRE